MLLDSRPSDPNRALQMETQHVPSIQAVDAKGETYARIAPTFFPCETNGESRLVHHITSYNKQALWDAVKTWFDGGAEASGAIHPEGAILHQFTGKGGATWRIYPDGTPKEEKAPLAWNSFATPMAADPNTFGYRWDLNVVKQTDSKTWSAGEASRVFPPGEERCETAMGSGAGGGGPGGNGFDQGALRPPQWETPQSLCHARGCGELLEEARPQSRTVSGAPGGRQRGHLLLVSLRRPTGLAQRRLDGSGAGGPAGARGKTPPELEERPGLPGPTRVWQTGGTRPGLDRHSAAGPGGRLCPHRHPTSSEGITAAMKQTIQLIPLFLVATLAASHPVTAATKPVRVFILAGQSNMEGAGQIKADPKRNGGKGSLEFLVKDAATAKHFAPLVDSAGQWRTRDDVWISYLDRKGPLTVGFGARRETIGPELGFGWVMGDALDEPVLLIKCAWGGKSLAVDFRPPSAGKPPYSLGEKGDAAIARTRPSSASTIARRWR